MSNTGNNCGSLGSTTTIQSPADATALATCTVYQGSIAIGTDAAGILNFNGIKQILGNLVVKDVGKLTSLTGNDLQSMNGNFTMSNDTLLSTLSFPNLTSVGTISFVALPSISQFGFTKGISSATGVIVSNTFLSTLDGLLITNADSVSITNNNRLRLISMDLETARHSVLIEKNGILTQISFPNLTIAGSMTLRNISSISLPALNLLSGDLSLENTYLTEFAVDRLSVVQALKLRDNPSLGNTSFRALVSAGNIDVGNNTRLGRLGFEKLGSVVGDVWVSGKLSSMEMPVLTSANGTFNLSSTDQTFDCTPFDTYRSRSLIKGSYSCAGIHTASTNTTLNNPTNSTTDSESGPNTTNSIPLDTPTSALSTGAKAGIAIAVIVTFLALGTGIFFLWRRKMKRRENTGKEKVEKGESDGKGGIIIGTDGKAELDDRPVERREMATGNEAHEVAEDRGRVEMAGERERAEMGGQGVVWELDGEDRGASGRGEMGHGGGGGTGGRAVGSGGGGGEEEPRDRNAV